ncbi:MAG: hypothetical protein PHR26_03495 [Candidatus ainarchaeum sp.]|nr:hypothetical protein [Candidatus ainarchaeum sp.]MDD3976434.1 hypothetical protein [Candidatus ainarchaeum sp.]
MNVNFNDLEKMQKYDSEKLTTEILPAIQKYDMFRLNLSNVKDYPTIVELYKFQFEYFITLRNIDDDLKNKLNLRLLEIKAYLYGNYSAENNWLKKKTLIFLYISLALSPIFTLAFEFINTTLKLDMWITILTYLFFVLVVLSIFLLIFMYAGDAEFKRIRKNLKVEDLF